MQTKSLTAVPFCSLLIIIFFVTITSCQKNISSEEEKHSSLSKITDLNVKKVPMRAQPHFNLQVVLRGTGKSFGLIKFRQDNDEAKIVTLDVWVRDLEPNHQYLLQRAVDTNLDGNCTSTSWLTLGNGLTTQSIMTNEKGTGRADLWRDLSTLATGAIFDIHFQVVDAQNMAVVLTSDCYEYTVR